ncbi:hypothetical protein TNCT_239761 [Trichonephila clavata]|uniref:Uncharacterized protein n=1 Tax=Trichonephila clavata TaxID=2740835 RepID=A0A8X6KTR6_TRICU|nr:hypothetical protein TNCT_239761 [Trichonephila clavata]
MEDGEQREKKKRLKEEEKVPERRQRHFILSYRSSSIPTWDLTPGVKKSLKGYAKNPEEYIGECEFLLEFLAELIAEFCNPFVFNLSTSFAFTMNSRMEFLVHY